MVKSSLTISHSIRGYIEYLRFPSCTADVVFNLASESSKWRIEVLRDP